MEDIYLTGTIDYNAVNRVSVMVSIIFLDNIAQYATLFYLSFFMESTMETPKRTSDADVNVSLT